ncbi:hypothetical protein Fot_27421 [Forsythia ovata]|uniref:Uncharacterized protein n=1 Tax=Forsythia ovata TaxID=205694 RepID=A0ABD1TL43_9LAMI
MRESKGLSRFQIWASKSSKLETLYEHDIGKRTVGWQAPEQKSKKVVLNIIRGLSIRTDLVYKLIRNCYANDESFANHKKLLEENYKLCDKLKFSEETTLMQLEKLMNLSRRGENLMQLCDKINVFLNCVNMLVLNKVSGHESEVRVVREEIYDGHHEAIKYFNNPHFGFVPNKLSFFWR